MSANGLSNNDIDAGSGTVETGGLPGDEVKTAANRVSLSRSYQVPACQDEACSMPSLVSQRRPNLRSGATPMIYKFAGKQPHDAVTISLSLMKSL